MFLNALVSDCHKDCVLNAIAQLLDAITALAFGARFSVIRLMIPVARCLIATCSIKYDLSLS